MTLSNYKLYCGDRKNNVITSTVNLYTSLEDVKGDGELFVYNNQKLYAKRGDVTHKDASRIRVGNKQQGVERALLTKNETIIYVDEFVNKAYNFSSVSGKNLTISNKYYKQQWLKGEFYFDNPVESILTSDDIFSGLYSSTYTKYLVVYVNGVKIGDALRLDKENQYFAFNYKIPAGRVKLEYDHEPVDGSSIVLNNLRIIY